MVKDKKGFTLIELIAVLVIMAIIALIVTPLVMSIIRKAKISADKRSIDAYGRSIELAIAGYLLDNGTFPTSIEQLTIEYSGDEVVCATTQINPDSSVYLSDCKVNNREVSNYIYGTDKIPTYQAYKVGDTVTYNNIDFYVIKDSGANDNTVTLLKAEPLTVQEVNTYGGVGTANNHVNMYNCGAETSCFQTAYDDNGYGSMAYFSSSTCDSQTYITTGCTTDYTNSEIKYVVDAWKNAEVPDVLEARLIKFDELETEPKNVDVCGGNGCIITREFTKYDWLKNYYYWTMTPVDNSTTVYGVSVDGGVSDVAVNQFSGSGVRPVIVLPKSALN